MESQQSEKKPQYIDTKSPILHIECQKAFENLTENEKHYAYYFSRASWEGAKVCYFQCSYESPALFYLFTKIFTAQTLYELKLESIEKGITEEDWTKITAYIAGVYQNCGNYFAFGDTKFIPEVSPEVFWKFITLSTYYKENEALVEYIWNSIKKEVYTYSPPYYQRGMKDEGCTTAYYSSNISKNEAEKVNKFIENIGISALNTRVVKRDDNVYIVLIASSSDPIIIKKRQTFYKHEDMYIELRYKDFNFFMDRVAQNLELALPYAANQAQKDMLQAYIEHFRYGDINKHKDSQRFWIKDKGPIVETNIGFIETYHDPLGVRAEYEGMVAIVNKEESKKLGELVAGAEKFVTFLPWGKDFEKDKFLRPDFTSLEILTFACSGTPLGINIPNYDDIRQIDGFKNVSLGNCLPAPKKESVNFVDPNESNTLDLYIKYFKDAIFLKVALHELLGHGSGKLFQKEGENKFNFALGSIIHPFTNKPVETYYGEKETWSGKFGKLSNPYEECRADSVALYLATYDEIMEILLPGRNSEWDDIVFVCWYQQVLGSILGLEFFNTELNKWGQAHRNGGHVITQVLLEAGNDFIKIKEIIKDGKPYLYISLDRNQIRTTGKEAIGNFLKKLQVYKCTGDYEQGSAMFEGYSVVDNTFRRYRDIVLDNKKPRRIELQDDLNKQGNEIQYVSFPESFEGIIESHLFHYRYFVDDVLGLWKEYKSDLRAKN